MVFDVNQSSYMKPSDSFEYKIEHAFMVIKYRALSYKGY